MGLILRVLLGCLASFSFSNGYRMGVGVLDWNRFFIILGPGMGDGRAGLEKPFHHTWVQVFSPHTVGLNSCIALFFALQHFRLRKLTTIIHRPDK